MMVLIETRGEKVEIGADVTTRNVVESSDVVQNCVFCTNGSTGWFIASSRSSRCNLDDSGKGMQEIELHSFFKDENGSDTDGYCSFCILTHIFYSGFGFEYEYPGYGYKYEYGFPGYEHGVDVDRIQIGHV